MEEKKTNISQTRRSLSSSPGPIGKQPQRQRQPSFVKRLFRIKRDTHGRVPSDLGSNTSHHWSRNGQRVWLFLNFLVRWGITVALCLSTIGVMLAYDRRWVLTTSDKHIYNFLVTGFFIGIGVNLTASLSHFAEKASWLLLSLTSLPPHLFELVMEVHKQSSVLRLAWKAKGRWRIRLACLAWLALMLAAQIGPAILGLTYELDTPSAAPGLDHIARKKGNASIADLSYIGPARKTDYQEIPLKGSAKYWNVQRAAANEYGQATSNWGDKNTTDFANANVKFTNYFVIPPEKAPGYQLKWFFRFLNYNAEDKFVIDPMENLVSSRYPTTWATCKTHDKHKQWLDLGKTQSSLTLELASQNYTIHMAGNIHNGTTYISDPAADFGPRSTRVFVLWSGIFENLKKWGVYECISYVDVIRYGGLHTNVVEREDMQLPDDQARIVAGAIGWSGLASSDAAFQYQTYSSASRWSSNEWLSEEAVANGYVARFSIGVLNAMNFEGPRRIVPNTWIANGGLILVVKWAHTIGVIVTIIGVHLVLLIIADLMLSNVLVRDSGPLATAVFLRPLLRNIPVAGGGMLRGNEIARTVGKDHVIYTWEEHGEYHNSGVTSDYIEERESDGVRYIRAKTANVPMERRKFDTGDYD